MATVNRTRKYIAEFIGTFVLVLVGCGTAVAVGCDAGSPDAAYFMTAVAFGLAVVAMAYSVGNVSGCHINPAISLAMFLDRRLDLPDLIGYVAAQCLGALVACIPIGIINGFGCGMGANVAAHFGQGLVVEFFLTFVFVFVVMGATDRAANASTAGLVIGLSLVLVHLMGIAYTGTSVNPARSLGPAIFNLFAGNPAAFISLWVFIVGPLAGGACAAIAYRVISPKQKKAAARKGTAR